MAATITNGNGQGAYIQPGQKELKAMSSFSLRQLVDKINSYQIQKEDIVTIMKDSDTFTLLYYSNISN